ncbi:hypothetical protein N7478_010715 [Penicillium angulare]|uniref:uncharacterized protein n=1 Tax=Penicillium angulare TaxID=116970 RepID=UPI0025420157|nr:uncharacterized protein N7478_010715 [Penicillium angulare]KAJ5267907.1 hypothetical protein N7478_010715 [Penicillium angulare]
MKLSSTLYFVVGTLLPIFSPVQAKVSNHSLQQWLYTSDIDEEALALLDRPEIHGVQSLYTWKSLEPQRGQYEFSAIANDLNSTRAKGKNLWVQIQDRSFSVESNPVPNYLHKPIYNNGSVPQCDGDDCGGDFVVSGWAAAQWNPYVRDRFQCLLKALATSFDGAVFGFNLPETSIEVQSNSTDSGYTCKGYYEGTLDNAQYAASVFKKSYAVQYVNFWPCGWANARHYISDSFHFFAEHGVGIGGPDNIPYKQTMENNAYPYMSKYRNEVPINVVAVQEPDLAAINPNTSKPFTKEEFVSFAEKELGSQILFWALSAAWLHQ